MEIDFVNIQETDVEFNVFHPNSLKRIYFLLIYSFHPVPKNKQKVKAKHWFDQFLATFFSLYVSKRPPFSASVMIKSAPYN